MSDRVVRPPAKRWGPGEWIGVIGIVIGILVSSFTWWASEKTRDLSFRLTTDRAEILKSGVSSDITAFYKGVEIRGDLIAYRFVVWNAGREPIRWTEDVLKEVAIQPTGGMKLLEAKVVRASREEIGLTVAERTVETNKVVLKWKILERGDGAVIQVLATNVTSPPFLVTGTVVGQRALDIESVYANEKASFLRKLFGDRYPFFWAFLSSAFVSLIIGYVFSLGTISLLRRFAPKFHSTTAQSKIKTLLVVCALLAMYSTACMLTIALTLFPSVFTRIPAALLGS